MTIGRYLRDKILIIILNILCAFFLSIYLLVVGNTHVTIALILVVWTAVVLLVILVDYLRQSRYFGEINSLMDSLDQPYLIQELMRPTGRLNDALYHDILYKSNKAVIEQINQLRGEQKEYREFIESWIHEVKLPITGMRLACHNIKSDEGKRLEIYLSEMDHIVEQALFYARSEAVYKDFQIREINLEELITSILSKNKYLLIQNQMNANVLMADSIVYSDKKWIEYIITQIIINAVKYKCETGSEITFDTSWDANNTKLIISDNGIGIKEDELPQIFNKGFTGTNGRTREHSTGIGLYLCKKLCNKLDVGINCESVEGKYTRIVLIFGNNTYLTKM
ncbi:MAG: sensor histidine kinase [Suipraeoptans sp.]